MFSALIKRGIVLGAFFVAIGCSTLSVVPHYKWVPYPIKDITLPSGIPAFFLVFEDEATTCAGSNNPDRCRKYWDDLPAISHGQESYEITYLGDYGKGNGGVQQTRISKDVFCALITQPLPGRRQAIQCNDLWEYFTKWVYRSHA